MILICMVLCIYELGLIKRLEKRKGFGVAVCSFVYRTTLGSM